MSDYKEMDKFVRDRITKLRIQKGVTEYKMSYDLGHSKSYINNITVRNSLPSLGEFFAICDYFDITPKDFFDTEQDNPKLNKEVSDVINKLKSDDAELVLMIMDRLCRGECG